MYGYSPSSASVSRDGSESFIAPHTPHAPSITHTCTSPLHSPPLPSIGELGVPFLKISAPEVVSGMSGESEQKVNGGTGRRMD